MSQYDMGTKPEASEEDVLPESNHNEAIISINDDIPDGGYGWVCVIGICMVNSFTWGIIASYGVYLSYYLANDIFPGATDLDYAFVGGANFAAALGIAPGVNVIVRKYGTNTSMFIGVGFVTGGFIAASFAKQFWQLCLTQGVMVGLGTGLLFVSSIPVVSQWFRKKRSLAQGICSAGSGVGGIIASASTTPMIEHISLAWSLRVMGLICFVTLFIASCLVRDRNASIRPRQHPFDIKFFRRYDCLLLLGWGFFTLLGYMTFLYSLPDYTIAIGTSQSTASITVILVNLATGIGRPLTGIVSDKCGRITTAMAASLICALLDFVVWMPTQSLAGVLVFSILIGNIFGIFWTTIAPVTAEVVGLQELPSMLSLCWLNTVLPCFFSEALTLKLRREGLSVARGQRPYLYPQIYAGVCYIVGGLCLMELRRVKVGHWWRIRERHG